MRARKLVPNGIFPWEFLPLQIPDLEGLPLSLAGPSTPLPIKHAAPVIARAQAV